ncbi:MAG TPA: hypothetical protein DCW68_06715 [Rhodospirillaceae bacterium]|nr:MAG: hypothetical protein A2018_01225 [Alphaproteobacteria bacterium GWF2_58_20]HAU29779.1 hypothetical protein [Rhodospirillaceae bacterium]
MKIFSSKAIFLLGAALFSWPAFADNAVLPDPKAVVEVSLGAHAGKPVGVLSPEDAGVSEDLWLGYDRDGFLEAVDMIRRLPPSPMLARMVRNALLADAILPFGTGPDDAAIQLGRTRALLRAGMLVEASRLAQAWPEIPVREDLARTLVEAMFLAGDNDAACLEVQAMRNVFSGSFWLKARTVCQFLVGEGQAGMLSVEILRDQGNEDAFLAVADAMQGEGRNVAQVDEPDALLLALMRVAGVPLLGVETRGHPVMMAALAMSSEASPQARLEAGLGLAGFGIWDADMLSRVLAKVSFDAREIRDVDAATGETYGVRLLPLTFQALASKPRLGKDDDRRAALVLRAMAQMPVVSGGVADVFRNMLAPLAPEKALSAAVEASALFYLGQQDELAGNWRMALLDAGHADVARLWPLAVLAGHADMDGFADWRVFQQARGDVFERGGRVLGILEAMGQDISLPVRVRFMQMEEGQRQDPVLAAALEMAAAKGQQGRVILLSVRILSKGVQAASLADLKLVLSLLREVGLGRWADALAREALAPLL